MLERGIRRRLERLADPAEVFHPIDPQPQTGFPEPRKPDRPSNADVARRAMKRMQLEKQGRSGVTPAEAQQELAHEQKPQQAIELGDSVAARARRIRKGKADSSTSSE